MHQLRNAMGWSLALMSVYMIFEGVVVAVSISGTPTEHSGNEFWMLAALAHQIALIMVWLGIYALREVLPADKP